MGSYVQLRQQFARPRISRIFDRLRVSGAILTFPYAVLILSFALVYFLDIGLILYHSNMVFLCLLCVL